jgi:hypothetical protein
MFGAYVRAAAGFAGAMLVATVAREVTKPFILPRIADELGTDHLLYTSINGVVTWLPVIVLFAVVIAIVARGATESRLPG